MLPLILTLVTLTIGILLLLRARTAGNKKGASTHGRVASSSSPSSLLSPSIANGPAPRRFILRRKAMISPDTALLSFEPHHDDVRTMGPLVLAAGRHMYVFFDSATKGAQKRPYSPIHNDEKRMDIVVKRYAHGVGSVYMHNLEIGDVANFRGPSGRFDYSGIANGSITHIGMLAGGTGITPMYQLLRHIFESSLTPKPTVHLLFSNRTEADTLLGDELRALAAKHASLQVEFIYSCVKRCDHLHISASFAHFIETGGLTLICGPESYQRSMIDIMALANWTTTSESHRLFLF